MVPEGKGKGTGKGKGKKGKGPLKHCFVEFDFDNHAGWWVQEVNGAQDVMLGPGQIRVGIRSYLEAFLFQACLSVLI